MGKGTVGTLQGVFFLGILIVGWEMNEWIGVIVAMFAAALGWSQGDGRAMAANAGTNVCLRRVDAKLIFDAMREHGVTHYCGAPIVHSTLMNADPRLREGIRQKVFGMVAAVVLAQGSVVRSVAMVVLGLFLGLIGTDIASGQTRFTFGISALADGVGFVPVAMGLFGIAEVISSLERGAARPYTIEKISRLWPTREEARQAWPAVLRGTGIGSLLGVLPGGGALISSFASYVVEKKLAKDPSRFGQGAVEGVAGPESANGQDSGPN
jgi:hypothetical protein